MGNVGKAHAAKTPPRERILRAADELFGRYGIRGVGVEAIAETAGTNKTTLYRHFESKDDLVAAWLKTVIESRTGLWETLEQMPETLSPRAKVGRFLDLLGEAIAYYGERGCALMNSLAELPDEDHPARRVLGEYRAETRTRLAKFFRSVGISTPDRTAEEIQLLIDGAKAGLQDCGADRSRTRLVSLARTLLESRLAA